MAVLFADPFVGTDSTNIGNGWTIDVSAGCSFTYLTNQARGRANGAPGHARLSRTPVNNTADIILYGSFVTPASLVDQSGSVWIRGSAFDTAGDAGYLGGWDILANTFNLAKKVGGAYTLLAGPTALTYATSTRYYWRLEGKGTAIKWYLAATPWTGSYPLSVTDSSNAAAGDVAVYSYNTNSVNSDLLFDDVTIENFDPGPPPRQLNVYRM